ncbi:Gfo/Idh/MocA family protein [Metabacillus herbersteinensis]|uniref:Gfo/Idh/MocA family protein n=1 Tax=Metabacillus herbersteinensis TaxID=283816 RepID=A0ABV6GFY4_9BACI
MLKIGIVGTGWFSGVHGKILSTMEGVQIKAVLGTTKQKADEFAYEFDHAKGYGNFVEMLDCEKLDAVYICVPPFAHGELELQLIERGIPFLVEKPLSVDLEVPKQVISKLQRNPLITSVGYHFRYRDSVKFLKNELENSTLGMVTGGWMGSMPTVSWWRNQETSGGQFVEQTTHLVDLLRYSAGEVEEVYAVFGSRSLHKTYDFVTVPDIGTVTLKMKSGVIANLSNTCILPDGDSKVGLDYYSDKGILHINHDRLEKSIGGLKSVHQDTVDPYLLENEAFLHAVRTGDSSRVLSNYYDAFRTQEVAVAALKSAESGEPVKINL